VSCFGARLGRVYKGQARVCGAVVVTGAELGGGEEMEVVCVLEDSACHKFLKELTTAFHQGNRSICLCQAVVWFVGFWDGDDRG